MSTAPRDRAQVALRPSCQSNTAVAAKVAETAIDDAQPRDVAHNQTHKSSSAQAI